MAQELCSHCVGGGHDPRSVLLSAHLGHRSEPSKPHTVTHVEASVSTLTLAQGIGRGQSGAAPRKRIERSSADVSSPRRGVLILVWVQRRGHRRRRVPRRVPRLRRRRSRVGVPVVRLLPGRPGGGSPVLSLPPAADRTREHVGCGGGGGGGAASCRLRRARASTPLASWSVSGCRVWPSNRVLLPASHRLPHALLQGDGFAPWLGLRSPDCSRAGAHPGAARCPLSRRGRGRADSAGRGAGAPSRIPTPCARNVGRAA